MTEFQHAAHSEDLFRSEGFMVQRSFNKLLYAGLCDPFHFQKDSVDKKESEDAGTVPSTPLLAPEVLSPTPRGREIAFAIYESSRHSKRGISSDTPEGWRSAPGTGETVSPLTIPRELLSRNRNMGTPTLNSSRRRLFSPESMARRGPRRKRWAWLFVLVVLLGAMIWLFIAQDDATSVAERFQNATKKYLESTKKWMMHDAQAKANTIFSVTISDMNSKQSRDSVRRKPPSREPGRFLATDRTQVSALSTVILRDKQQPAPQLPTRQTRPPFRIFLRDKIQKHLHYVLAIAVGAIIPGMTWVLVVAVIGRVALIGT